MDIVYLLIVLALVLAVVIEVVFCWAIKHRQFDDLEGPAHAIVMDDDSPARVEKGGAPTAGQRGASNS